MGIDLLTQAARGDRVALGELAVQAVALARGGEVHPLEGWAAAETYARLAAAHGDDLDLQGLAGVLFMRAGWERDYGRPDLSRTIQAEAILICDALADRGNEEAATTLAMATRVCDPNAFQLARGLPYVERDVGAMEARAEAMKAADQPGARSLAFSAQMYRAQQLFDVDEGSGIAALECGLKGLVAAAKDGDAGCSTIVDILKRALADAPEGES